MEDIASKVISIIVYKLGAEESEVTPAASFKNDLGADSLDTVELIMLYEDCTSSQLTIINLTGDIDEEFLCFLYNNKTFKN